MKKRFLAAFLCLCLLLCNESVAVIVNSEEQLEENNTAEQVKASVDILLNGEKVSDFYIEEYEKKTVTASVSGITAVSYRWQIRTTNSWVNIYDRTGDSCDVSLALVKSLLDDSGCAYLRCAVTDTDGNTYYSDPLSVTVFSNNSLLLADDAQLDAADEETAQGEDEENSGNDEGNSGAAYVTITIEYVYIDGADVSDPEAAQPYVAKIRKGESFNQTVVSPAVVGYEPYNGTGEDKTSAATVPLSYTEVTKDETITVYYHPAKVRYAVRYFFQNVNDDLYTENERFYKTGTALTGSTVSDLSLSEDDTVGFTKLYHIPEKVAADGSTVFECYYDRDYMLIDFDCDGGYGVEPIYARYGTLFVVNDPVRYGYIFNGWDKKVEDKFDGVADNVSTEIKTDEAYKALWTEAETSYTVAYWCVDSGNNISYYIGNKVVSAQTAGTKIHGSDDLTKGSIYICGKEEAHVHTKDCFSSDHTHTIDCYNSESLNANNTPGPSDKIVINRVDKKEDSDSDPGEDGYLYVITATGDGNFYPYLKLGGNWYKVSTSYYKGCDEIATASYSNGSKTWTVNKYKPLADNCAVCGKTAHEHKESCKVDTDYLIFAGADGYQMDDSGNYVLDNEENWPVIDGDGSTVINVYYKHRDYTLRFYYARSYEDSGDTVFQVVGGSTYSFGATADASSLGKEDAETDALTLLANQGDWGKVQSLPTVRDGYIPKDGEVNPYKIKQDSVVNKGQDISGTSYDVTYYYLEFTASFNSDISSVWPVDIFEPVAIAEKHSSSSHTSTDNQYCKYPYAYFSAWNGQYGVHYSHENENQTIKGAYQYLDTNLIFNTKYGYEGETTVSYLCFWENGADVGWSIPMQFNYKLWKTLLPGETADNSIDSTTNNGTTYYLFKEFAVYDNQDKDIENTINGQTAVQLEGFDYQERTYSKVTNNVSLETYDVNFFYSGTTKTKVHFQNYNKELYVLSDATYGVKMTEALSDGVNGWSFFKDDGSLNEPPYPDALEPNAYTFAGWYTTAECLAGSEYDLKNATMPSKDLTLYAKWEPTEHSVKFYLDKDKLEADEPLAGTDGKTTEFLVKHGNALIYGDIPAEPTNGEMTFLGWYYMDNGEKKRFLPASMKVKKDLQLFAEWRSQDAVDYVIHYYKIDGDGNETTEKIADDTHGRAYVGTTRTFQAKAGGSKQELYENENGWYPQTATSSLTVSSDSDQNVVIFYYRQCKELTYTVRYLHSETKEVLVAEKIQKTTDAVVTVRAETIDGYISDALYKRLVLSADENQNVITFYYNPNAENAHYAIHYLYSTIAGAVTEKDLTDKVLLGAYQGNDKFELSEEVIDGIAQVGTTVTVAPTDVTGFAAYTKKVVVKKGTEVSVQTDDDGNGEFDLEITKDGSEIYVFYIRQKYQYTVNYLLYGNSAVKVDEPKTEEGYYGEKITEELKVITGYTCVLNAPTTITITASENANVINYEYRKNRYEVKYVPVINGTVVENAGWLTQNQETVLGDEAFTGTKALQNSFYQFKFWSESSTEKTEITKAEVSGDDKNKIVPKRDSLSDTQVNYFYAWFEPYRGDLTINFTNLPANQALVFELKNKQTGQCIYFTVTESGNLTIKNACYNEYILTLDTDWAWRYDVQSVTFTHQSKSTTAEFALGAVKNNQWISGSNMVTSATGQEVSNGS